MNLRELHRKERGNCELESMIKRYDAECGECITHKATPEEIAEIERKCKYKYKNEKEVNDFCK